MVISIPKITTNGTVATVAEGGATSETGIISSYVNGTVVKLSGMQRTSVEVQDRSGPAFAAIMMDNMERSYRKAAEAATIAAIVAGGTAGTNQAATVKGMQAFIALEAPLAYVATDELATAYVGGVSHWGLMMASLDLNDRPIFSAGAPQNTLGAAGPTSLFGNILGIPFYVAAGMVATTIDDSAFLIVPSAIEIFESTQLQLSVNVITTGEIEVMIYGYFCPIVTIATGLRKFMIA